ncbi:MAG: ribosome biogenesis factor YjgA [Gammaproteobacteria bacterium]
MSGRRRDDRPSRTRLKKEAGALQELGVALAALPPEALDELDLPEKLRQALDELSGIRSHGALRRQRQYVGRLMREVDPEPLQRALEAARQPAREEARRFRAAEDWRQRLLEGGEEALEAFLAACPAADRKALAQSIAEAAAGRSGASRRLFRRVREAMDHRAGPASPDAC